MTKLLMLLLEIALSVALIIIIFLDAQKEVAEYMEKIRGAVLKYITV